jgi:hypothetical protein
MKLPTTFRRENAGKECKFVWISGTDKENVYEVE